MSPGTSSDAASGYPSRSVPERRGSTRSRAVAQPLERAAHGDRPPWSTSATSGTTASTSTRPSAKNTFLLATRYRTGEAVAREVIAVTTLACLPIALAITLLLR